MKSVSGEEQNIDRAFFHCLKEIEISYTSLPKILRLRIEKWVEKFITVGFNSVWKRNRNMYAKLLLSMIISQSLSDPFHVSPGEGDPLPPFPSYLIPKFKSALGPHESYFWRNIFDRVHEPALHTFTPAPSHSHPRPPPPSSTNTQQSFAATPSPSYIKLDPTQKETYNLRLLMKEQSRRIELMEEQMQQERLKHQRDMHQVLEQTQDETNRIKDMYRSSNNADRSVRHSYQHDSITSSNPYEIYDGNTTYGIRSERRPLSPQRSPMKFHLGTTASDTKTRHTGNEMKTSSSGRINASYLPQDISQRPPSGVPYPKPMNDSFIPESKYQQHHNPHSKHSDSYFDHNPTGMSTNQDYSIGVPVFTPGKEDNKTSYHVDSTSQQKTPLRSASKNVYFEDNKHDIKPLSFVLDNENGNGNRENKDIFPPQQRSRGDIAPNMIYSQTNPPLNNSNGNSSSSNTGRYAHHDVDTSYDFTQPNLRPAGVSSATTTSANSGAGNNTPVKKSSPFVKENIWPDYQNEDFSTNNDTTYERAKSTVNRRDSNVAPILKRDVPEDEGEFMNYLEDFQKELRHLQFNTTHNKGA